jgi:hypothetical protein
MTQAILHAMSETSKVSIFFAPLSPLSSRVQVASTPQPSGVSIPIPVTTTRLMAGSERIYCRRRTAYSLKLLTSEAIEQPRRTRSAFGVLFKKFNRVANGQNGFSGIVGDLAAKFFFEGHNELNRVEAVGAKIIDKAGLIVHLVGFYAQVLHDDLLHPLANVTHRSNLVLYELGCAPTSVRNHRDTASSWLTVMRRSPIAEHYSALSRPSRAESRLPYFKSID